MNRRRLALVLGVGLGALAFALTRRLREQDRGVSADSLAESLRDQLATLEDKIERVLSRKS